MYSFFNTVLFHTCHDSLTQHFITVLNDRLDVFACVGSDGDKWDLGVGGHGCDEFVRLGVGGCWSQHEWELFHEDAEVEEGRRDGEATDVVFDDGFAVEVEDAGDFAASNCVVLVRYFVRRELEMLRGAYSW